MSKKAQPTVKIPAIRQLPSGAYFCQLRLDGQSVSITDEDYNTVYAKAIAYKAGVIQTKRKPTERTVGDAISAYISSRRAVSSPSTICGYETIRRTRFKKLQTMQIKNLTLRQMQIEINAEAALCSPKTLKNAYGLIASAIVFAGGERYDVALPQVPPADKLFLEPEEIPTLTEAVKGTRWEIPVLLGLLSCRRSEIYGMTWDNIDLKKRTVKVSGSVVPDEHWKLTEKRELKNRQSVRILPMTDQLHAALSAVPPDERTGHVVKPYPFTPAISGSTISPVSAFIRISKNASMLVEAKRH